MKKVILIVLAVVVVALVAVLALTGNNDNNSNKSVTCQELYEKIKDAVTLPEEMVARSSSDLDMRYGIDTTKAANYIFMANATSYYVDVIAIFKVENSNDRKEFETSLSAIKKQAEDSMNNYDAEQYKIAKDGVVYTSGEYVILIMTSDVNGVKNVIKENI